MDEAFWQGLANATGGTVLPCDGSDRVIRPSYLGPQAEAQRDREQVAARLASPNRAKVGQDDPATLALFAGVIQPTFI